LSTRLAICRYVQYDIFGGGAPDSRATSIARAEAARIRSARSGDHPTITKLIDYQEFCGIIPYEASAADSDIDPVQVKPMMDRHEPFVLIDVREPHEYQICHIPYAKLIALGDLRTRVNELNTADSVVALCKSGMRSAEAVDFLKQGGQEGT
jgi:rhodanese-related sulfurtransferase